MLISPSSKLSLLPPFLFLLFASLIPSSYGQVNMLFQWKFGDNDIASQLPTCAARPIQVIPLTNSTQLGIPPYFMMAFPPGGTPRTYGIGNDPNNLSWTPDYPVGTQLLLSVVDSTTEGGEGGVPDTIFEMAQGQIDDCVNQDNQTDFTVTANVTSGGTLQTCQPWGITVQGGVPPYNFTLLENHTPNITNVTTTENALVYINRADPGRTLLVAVSDFTGRFATGTPFVQTEGTADTTCVGLNSVITNSTVVQQQTASLLKAQQAAKNKKQSVTIGVALTFVVFILLGCAYGYWYLRRRETLPLRLLALPPTPSESTSKLVELKGDLESAPVSEPSAPLSIIPPRRLDTRVTPFDSFDSPNRRPSATGTVSSVADSLNTLRSHPSFTTFPMSAAAQAKFAEVRARSGSLTASSMLPGNAVSRSGSASSAVSGHGGPVVGLSDINEVTERVIQHEDAEVVRELPPPYADRGERPLPPSFHIPDVGPSSLSRQKVSATVVSDVKRRPSAVES